MAASQVASEVRSEGGSVNKAWEDFFEQTKTVVKGYSPVLVYYVKAYRTADWKNLVGEDFLEWSAIDVLQQCQHQRASLETAGAHEQLFVSAEQLKGMLEKEEPPQSHTDRLRFHAVATEFVKRLPFVDLFPLNLEEKEGDKNAKMRKICGVFYSLQYQLDMPLRWFHYYAAQFQKTGGDGAPAKAIVSWRETLENAFGENTDPTVTEKEEDEFFIRHVLSAEEPESVVASIKRKRADEVDESGSH